MVARDRRPSIPDLIALAAFLGFVSIASSLVFSKGVCCGDDAYHAVIAKNLVDGLGYATTTPAGSNHFALSTFDYGVGTGPTTVLPAALFIRVFGNQYWVPGLANVTCWSVLMVLIALQVRTYNRGMGFALAVASFLYLSYTFTTWHIGQWYALLGEVPASLLVLLGVLLFLRSDQKPSKVLAGLCFGLAVLAKSLSALAIAAILLVFLLSSFLDHTREFRDRLSIIRQSLLPVALGFFLPIVPFELWKLSVLGLHDYLAVWRQYVGVYTFHGVHVAHDVSPAALYKLRIGSLIERFGLMLPDTAILFALVWTLIRNDSGLRRLFIIFASIIGMYFLWWTFFSVGWPRYYLIALIFTLIVAVLPFMLPFSSRLAAGYLALILLWSSYNWFRIDYPFRDLGGPPFRPSSRTAALIEVTQILTPIAARDEAILTQNWATVADIEYMLDDHLVFTHYRDPEVSSIQRPYWIVVNTWFMDKTDKAFAALLEGCGEQQVLDVYIIAECTAVAGP